MGWKCDVRYYGEVIVWRFTREEGSGSHAHCLSLGRVMGCGPPRARTTPGGTVMKRRQEGVVSAPELSSVYRKLPVLASQSWPGRKDLLQKLHCWQLDLS